MAAIKVITIKNIIDLGIYDENEQLVIFSGDVDHPTIHYKGRLCDLPDEFRDKPICQISAMGKLRREQFMLNKYGWTEIWLD